MKKTLLIVLAVTLMTSILFLDACSATPTPAPAPKPTPAPAPAPAPAPIKLRIASNLGEKTNNIAAGMAQWVAEVVKRTNGRVQIETFWGGSLVQQGEVLQATQKGTIDLGVIVSVYYPDELPLFGWDYGFMFSPTEPDIAAKLATKLIEHPAVRANIEKDSMKILGIIFLSSYSYNGSKPFRTFEDMKGVKVGVVGTEMPRWVEAAGGVPVTMGSPDRYQALQTGVIGGSLLSTTGMSSGKLDEVGKYVTLCELGSPIGSALCVNKNSWNKIPADIQKIMTDTGNEIVNWSKQYNITEYTAAQKTMTARGATIITLPFEEKVKWANAVPNLPAEWAKAMEAKKLPGTELVNYYLKAAKDLGYKWPREWTTN